MQHDAPDFRALFEAVPGMYLVLTSDLVIVAVSNAYVRATMTLREEIIGRRLFDVFPDNPNDATATGTKNLRASLESVLETRAPHAMAIQKYDIRRPESEGGGFEVRHWSPVNSPVINDDGRLTHLIHRVDDVTQLVRLKEARDVETEDALRASEDRFAKLAESGIIGVVIASLDGRMHEVNDAFCTIVGYSRDELLSGAVRGAQLTPPEWAEKQAIAGRNLSTKGVSLPWEKEFQRKDGTRVPVLIAVAMLGDSKCINIIADLSERKRAEEALEKSEEQLRHAQKMDAIGRLAGGLAHDFNNLLSVVVSYADLILGDLSPNDPMAADAAEIRTAGVRAGELTKQLLAFSRRQVLEPRVIDLNATLTQMGRMLQRVIGEHIELKVAPATGLGPVYVDPSQVEQVIVNLAINARDAMTDGGRLTIETANVVLDDDYAEAHAGVTPGPHVMLAITDTGTGMDKATQERIFEPFFTTKEVGKGTGLGLSTVYGIVKQSGGSIWLYSEPSRGTTFKVYFPRCEESGVESPTPPVVTNMRGTETVLLVEDDAQVRALLRVILTRHGYQVLEAEGGDEAIRFCARYSGVIHLLLTDVVMPRMSGRQLAETLAPLRSQLKVLYMSGYTDNTVVHHGVLDEGIDFLQKPIMPEALTRKVREVLDRKK